MAPTASFWDCAEFIACANEWRSHTRRVLLIPAYWAIVCSGGRRCNPHRLDGQLSFSICQCLHSDAYLLDRAMLATRTSTLNSDGEQPTSAIMGSGAIAGLTTAFSDSFWFNAVEAEVYALSSFFTALVVWLMFKWEQRADQQDHTRYLILIAYVMGLSIGVHLLNLLTIPALALIFYFRKYDFSWRGLLATVGISGALLVFIQYGIIQETFELAWSFERFFTGTVDRWRSTRRSRNGT